MSRDIFKETKDLPAVTIFWGGKGWGKCIQLTKLDNPALGHQYIKVPVRSIERLIQRLVQAKQEARKE
jgi:hypothetical protein